MDPRKISVAFKSRSSFTLMELLIVIGILAILATVTVLVLNPMQMIAQARDSQRLSELQTINKALGIFQSQNASGNFGTSNTVYISIPDSSSTCANLGLPTLPSGWTYSCVTQTNLQKTNGTGWIPVDFTTIQIGSPLDKLPIDPVNTTSTSLYYTYVPGGSWELTSLMESDTKHDKAISDGGIMPGVYELGTHIGLTPATRDLGLVGYWKFDEGTGTTAYDSSPYKNNGTLYNSPTWTDSDLCKSGGCLTFDGVDDYVDAGMNTFTSNAMTFTIWVKTTINTSATLIGRLNNSWASAPNGAFNVACGSNGTQIFNSKMGGTTQNMSYTKLITNGNWHHVVFVWNGSSGISYVDGVFDNSKVMSGEFSSSVNLIWLGARQLSSSRLYFNGSMDDVRIYNRALSATEVQAIYNATN